MAKAKIPDMASLKSDVASFASSLGFSSSSPSGFNDVDFRKSGRLKPLKNREKPQSGQRRNDTQKPETKTNSAKPKPKQPVLSLDDSIDASDRKHKYKNLPALPLVKAGDLSLWYEDALELEKKVFGEECLTSNRVGLRLLEEKRELGDRLMWQYVKEYEISRGRSGDIKMLMASQRSGTAADKVSAFSFIIADNPVANLRSLDALLGMVTSKVGKRYAFTGFEALKELFISKLLPDRKLKTLLQRPVNKIPETKDGYSLLLFWYWEDSLKPRYERFVLALEEASKDMLPSLKARALKTMYVMLKSKSEQERRLLTGLVNKLGDPQSKNASNADFYLSNLLSDHPNMKVVVIDEVDTFLFRPNLGLRAKYHAVNFLSQIRLSHKGDGPKAAKRLIDIYFALFKVLINEAGKSHQAHTKNEKPDGRNSLSLYSVEKKAKDMEESHVELDSRLLSALLTGVNRAFPYVSSNEADDIIGTQTPMLFKLVHSKNFNVGVQALMLLDKISSKNQIVSDRYYRALYSKLLLPATMNSSKAEMFIGLILRSMKSDVNLKRVCAFSKRLLQVALQQPPQYACGCLFLLSEVLKARPPLWNMVLQKESIDEDLEHFEDVNDDETENQPTTALKIEQNDSGINGVEGANPDSVSSEEEEEEADPPAYSDDDVSDDANEVLLRDVTVDASKSHVLSDHNVDKPQASSAIAFLPGGYNPRHREPSFCNADRASWWELMVLATHAHPSVATMAGTILSGANIVYNGNPLIDLSLSAFLDKFMEKKPKQRIWHGSQIEPSQQLDMSHQLIGPEILSLAEMDVQPEDQVFHKFYMNKMSSSKKAKKKKKKTTEEEDAEELYNVDGDDAEDGDDVEGGDESDNEEVENLLDSANLDMEAGGDYDYDDLDKVANEDDYDLVADASDAEIDAPAGIAEGEEFDFASEDDEIDDPDEAVDAEDVIDEDDGSNTRKRKRKMKSSKKDPVSPFASLEEYKHLLRDDVPSESKPKRKKGSKKERRKKST